eukprot:5162742-Amphidinium_carterae.1
MAVLIGAAPMWQEEFALGTQQYFAHRNPASEHLAPEFSSCANRLSNEFSSPRSRRRKLKTLNPNAWPCGKR